MNGWIHVPGTYCRYTNTNVTVWLHACMYFFLLRIVLLSCRKEEHDQTGRGFLSVGSGGKRSMMCLLVTFLVLGEDRGR